MRVVVVGATGNLGSALVRQLLASGDEVTGVSRRSPGPVGVFADVDRWHSVDVGAPDARVRLTEALGGADAVVNFAWGFQPTRRPSRLYRTGVVGSANVLAAAVAVGVPHLIHTSSVGAYAARVDSVPVGESFPTTGITGSVYSQHKALAEAHLDQWESANAGQLVITRIRPGFVLQADAGAALFRYGLPGWLPGVALRLLPVLPLHRSFIIPVVHTEDIADAVTRILKRRAGGAFNLAATQPVTRDDVAHILGARTLDLAPGALAAIVQAAWRAQLQPLDGGWIRLAYQVPLLDSTRAHTELDWSPRHEPISTLTEAVDSMRHGHGAAGPVLRPRTVQDGIRRLARSGPISRRTES